jgi:transposase
MLDFMKQSKLIVIVWLVFGFAIVADGQTGSDKPVSPAKKASAKPAAVDPELKERRARARALLISLSSDARTFNDQTLRARSLARIADALWRVDAEQGRLLFRKAWEAAEVADLESDKKLQEEIRQQKARTGGGFATNLPPNIRREVLSLAARHDRTLGEEFLEKLKAQKLEAANSVTANQSPWQLSEALSQRLAVAIELLMAGETERALQFAEPALAVVSIQSINFLSDLREKDPSGADSRYAALLASAANNPQSDANSVSLLSSYIFTPHLFLIFSGNGISTSQSSSTITPASVAPELRAAFFLSGASILLRPLPPAGQDQGPTGVDGKYLVIKRLLPFFEQSAPAEMVESLRTHLNALNTVVSEQTRRREARDDEWINKGVKPDRPAQEREQALLDRIDRAKTSAERDSLYTQLAYMAAGKIEMRARDFVSKVEDSEVRKQLQAYIDAYLAMNSVQKKLTDQALELVHKGELTPLQKAWVLTECAKILVKTDHQKALELVDQAATEARRIEVSDPSLPRALIAVANALRVVDAERVWDATFDAVKAANSAEGFSGEDGEIILRFQSKGQSSVNTSDIKDFDLEGIFKDLAKLDYDRAVELARGFQAEGPRAVATIAIAREVLEPKKQ